MNSFSKPKFRNLQKQTKGPSIRISTIAAQKNDERQGKTLSFGQTRDFCYQIMELLDGKALGTSAMLV